MKIGTKVLHLLLLSCWNWKETAFFITIDLVAGASVDSGTKLETFINLKKGREFSREEVIESSKA